MVSLLIMLESFFHTIFEQQKFSYQFKNLLLKLILYMQLEGHPNCYLRYVIHAISDWSILFMSMLHIEFFFKFSCTYGIACVTDDRMDTQKE